MAELELKRAPNQRRLYLLEGVGTLRLEGFGSRAATAEADGIAGAAAGAGASAAATGS